MLTIRAEQLRALGEPVMARLIAAAVKHIRLSLPEIYQEMGEEQVRESVLLAKSKSAEYGLETWSDVVGYLNAMYLIGFDFDENPSYPWAKEILESTGLPSSDRIARLVALAVKECEAQASPAN